MNINLDTTLDVTAEWADLKAIEAESIGWLPLGEGAYLHKSGHAEQPQDMVIDVVGLADACMAGMNVLWLV